MTVRRALDEHHRRQVVNVPISGNFYQSGILPPDQRLHPGLRLLAIVDLGPSVPSPKPVHLAVMMGHGVVVFNSVRKQEIRHLLARLPPWRHDAPRRFAAEIRQHAVRLVQNVLLLLGGHVAGILMAVAVQADLVACVSHLGAFLREGLQGVAGDEPCGFDVIFLEEFQETWGPHMTSPESCEEMR